MIPQQSLNNSNSKSRTKSNKNEKVEVIRDGACSARKIL